MLSGASVGLISGNRGSGLPELDLQDLTRPGTQEQTMNRPNLHSRLCMLAVLISLSASLVQAQTYTVLHNFNETEGCCSDYPAAMAQGRDGNIYGTTLNGGTHLYGNVFKMTPSGTLTSIYSFDFTNGAYPQGGISLGQDGTFTARPTRAAHTAEALSSRLRRQAYSRSSTASATPGTARTPKFLPCKRKTVICMAPPATGRTMCFTS